MRTTLDILTADEPMAVWILVSNSLELMLRFLIESATTLAVVLTASILVLRSAL
jgi:hypothetical protein